MGREGKLFWGGADKKSERIALEHGDYLKFITILDNLGWLLLEFYPHWSCLLYTSDAADEVY